MALTGHALRLHHWARSLIPVTLSLLLVLGAILPLPVPYYSVVAPALPLMAVYYWSVYRPDLMPHVAVFIIGVLVDIFAGTPIGPGADLAADLRPGLDADVAGGDSIPTAGDHGRVSLVRLVTDEGPAQFADGGVGGPAWITATMIACVCSAAGRRWSPAARWSCSAHSPVASTIYR